MRSELGLRNCFIRTPYTSNVYSLSRFARQCNLRSGGTALVQDHEETARINRELGQQAETHDNEVAAAKAAAYEKIPEIQALQALEAEERREPTKRPRAPYSSFGSLTDTVAVSKRD